jgi:hypothetical protein
MHTKCSITAIRLNYVLKAKVLEVCFLSFMRVDIGNDQKSLMYRGADKSLARPTSRLILFAG